MSSENINWKDKANKVKSGFAKLYTKYPEIVNGYKALNSAAESSVLDAKTRELIAIAVAVTTRCDGCISVHAQAARNAGATEEEITGALATAISLNAGAAYVYSLRALEAFDQNKDL